MEMFVLNETEQDGSATTVGVFDSPDISDATLAKYYGDELEVVEMRDVRDSGIEWQKKILVNGVGGILTLHYFTVGEI